MITKGIRGAITVDSNTPEAIKEATLDLLCEIFKKNNLDGTAQISHIIFTTTNDLNAAFPAKFPREEFGWDDVAMMCFHELDVPNALKMCLRVLVVINCENDFIPQFVYLKNAQNLRK
ncbi:MAG: chorismate mutase [Cyanobacteria bacterium SIG26]|nr:chorismate mutase [Cyanobacteria bacterium SIG26]MBQ7126286.1 chorismate mutase [bacterium]